VPDLPQRRKLMNTNRTRNTHAQVNAE